jgi:hypothetical protein
MDPQTVVAVTIVGALAAWGAWYAVRAYRVWRSLHGDRIVTCPETGKPAAVRFDIARAVTSDRGAAQGLPLEACSRWSERGPCEQPCAAAAQAPESAASAMAREWAAMRTCTACGASLLASEGAGHHFALRDTGGVSREWVDIAAERLPIELTSSLPMCWNCHIAETFRREHPELVTDRDFNESH